MKQTLKYSFLFASVLMISACDKGGGDSNNGGGKQAVVPTLPGPQGQIFAQGSQSTYCNFNNVTGTVNCSSINPYSSAACNTSTQTYTDINTLCQRLQVLQNEIGTCDASQAIQIAYAQSNCNSILGQSNTGWNQNIPNQQTDLNFKSVKCEFEASRVSEGKFLGIRTSNQMQTPHLTTLISFDARRTQSFDLRKYFIFDMGRFGNTTMTFNPAGSKNKDVRFVSDTISLVNSRLNGDKSFYLTQSGFAGENVSLELMSDDGNMKLSVSCKGQSTFRKNVVAKTPTQFVCSGTSRLYAGGRNDISISLPYGTNLLNSPIELADGLSAVITGDTNGGDNAKITFTADSVAQNTSLESSAYLKTATQLRLSSDFATVDLNCGPQ